MKTTPFFNASLLNDDMENLNDLKLRSYTLLSKVFAAVSVIAWLIGLLIPFYTEVKEICFDFLLLICFFSLVLTLIGYRNLRRWNFKLMLAFTISFGMIACLLLGTAMLAFTVPAAVFCFFAALACRLWRNKKVAPLIAPAAMTIIILLLFAVLTYNVNGIFLASIAAVHLLLFWLLTVLFFKLQANKQIIADTGRHVSGSLFLIAVYELLGFFTFLIGLMIWTAF